jgi:tetratricopeptide (TPR) repeat protein
MSHVALGDLAAQEKRFSDALREWEAARDLLIPLTGVAAVDLAVATEAGDMLLVLGNHLGTRGLSETVWGFLAPALRSEAKPTSANALTYAYLSLLRNDREGFRRACRRVSDLYATSPEWLSCDADLAMLFGLAGGSGIAEETALRSGKAGLRHVDHKEADHKEGEWPRRYLALANYRAGRYAEALSLLDQDGSEAPGNMDAYRAYGKVIRAMALQRLGRGEDARRLLAEARAARDQIGLRIMGQDSPESNFDRWGWAYLRLLLREAATVIGAEASPGDPWTDLFEAWAEAGYGRHDRARACLERVTSIADADPALHAARGHVRALLGDTEAALADQDVALRLDPTNLLARLDRGRATLARGKPEEAAADLVQVLPHLPDDREVYADRYRVDMLLASSDAAFARAVALRPDDRQLWTARGRYLAWHGRWKEAADAYARGIESRPLFYDCIEYGAALVLIGDHERYDALCARQAEEIAKIKDLKSFPWAADAYMGAARVFRLWPAPGPDRGSMVKWTDEALELDSGREWVLCQAAAARYRAGRYEEAIELARRSLHETPLWPGSEMNWYVLALSNHGLGHAEVARRWFHKAEAAEARKDREAARTPYPPVGYYLLEDLDARVLGLEARAVINPKGDEPKPRGPAPPEPPK